MPVVTDVVNARIKINDTELSNTLSAVVLEQSVDDHHRLRARVQIGATRNPDEIIQEQARSHRWLGSRISLEVERSDSDNRSLKFSGVVTRVSLENSVNGLNEIVVEAASPTILLDGARKNKIMTEVKASDAISVALGDHSMQIGRVEATSKVMPYLVQYRETDYAFIRRMASGAGLFSYYDGEKFQVVKAAARDEVQLDFYADVTQFALGLGMANTGKSGTAWDPTAKEALSSEAEGRPSGASPSGVTTISIDASKDSYPGYDYTTDHKAAADMASLDDAVKVAKDAAIGNLFTVRGESGVEGVRVGGSIRIAGMADYNGQYFVRQVTHVVREGGEYSNSFECIPLDLAYPQLSHPLPRITEVQTAIVTDNQDPDQLGRVKVKFSWLPQDESIWLRIAWPYAGKERGWYSLPEVDDEVLVAFEHGDPDMPVVIGSLYNQKDKPPEGSYNAENDVKMFMTRAGNLLKFVDTDGSEELTITQKDGKNTITLALSGPSISIESEGDISIKGKTIALESTSGDITVKSGGKLAQESSMDLTLKGGMNLKAEGSVNCELKGGAQTKLEGGAMTEIKGAMVKIN